MTNPRIQVIIESILKDEGFQRGIASISKTERHTKRASESVGKLEQGIKRAGQAMVGAFAVGAITNFSRVALLEFAAVERRLNAIAYSMQRIGLDAERELPKAAAHLEKIAISGGPLLSETLPVFQKFIGILRDTEAALYATSLAVDIAESGLKDTGSAGEILANILQGEAAEAAKSLGLDLDDLNGRQKTNAELLEEVIQQFQGLGAAQDDTSAKIARATAGWDRFKRGVGEAIAIVLDWLGKAHRAQVQTVAAGVTLFAELGKVIRTVGTEIGETLVAAFDWRALLQGPEAYLGGLRSTVSSGVMEIQRATTEALLKAGKAYNAAGANAAREELAGREKFLEEARDKAKQADLAEAQRRAEEARKAAEKRAQLEMQEEIKLQQARVQAAEQGTLERWEATEKLLKMQMAAELRKAELTEQAKRDIRARYALARQENNAELMEADLARLREAIEREEAIEAERQALILQSRKELWEAQAELNAEYEELEYERRLERLNEWLEARLEAYEGNEEAMANVQEAYTKKRQAIEDWREEEAARRQLEEKLRQEEAVASFFGAASRLFEGNKTLAIAEAVINTHAAVTRALNSANPPLSWILAATTLMKGMAQVKAIREQKLGGGFDDPRNDAMAVVGGRRWASDMIGLFGAGATQGFAQVMTGAVPAAAGATTSNTYTTTHGNTYNFQGTVIDRQSMQRFMRKARQTNRRDRSRRFA